MALEALGLKEHVFNILIEAGYETIGDLMLALKLDENKVLGLAGVGPKAIQNMHDSWLHGAPELPPEVEPGPRLQALCTGRPVELQPAAEEPSPSRRGGGEGTPSASDEDEEVEAENAKDGVSLDELFQMKPEIFRSATPEEDDAEKKKGKKKKKGVELVLDEELGEVVGRKKHKRGTDDELTIDE
jgi:hypothetical protein